ncbi:hypothetical protein [Erwinia sp. 198]|uniref:hypothetical protein n=1 Tax=Erwinia sp. 198 TaxID=2022746 RepID=UPI000F68BC4E|nr:hypothetical protein [Erwinia sp. 198]RRZ95823.1 hypothetical protein EGK14_04530 [Erwinia sp. 198]
MQKFFDTEDTKNAINSYRFLLEKPAELNLFQSERNETIVYLLTIMATNPRIWDEKTQFNIRHISQKLYSRLINADISDKGADYVFASLFRFFIEEYLSEPEEFSPDYQKIRDFARENIDKFSSGAREQVRYALQDMTTSLFKQLINGDEINLLRDYVSAKREAEQLITDWNKDLKERQDAVENLRKTLKEQKDAYNFVGLYKGFESLGNAKNNQLGWARAVLIALGVILPTVILMESLYFFFPGRKLSGPYDLVGFLPAISLMVILIYYFRVALSNYNSIRSQIMQIELRKSLCQFIQSYAEYSFTIKSKDSNLLNKFEDVIFSNIMASEDKVPSTFDGIEHLASLIGSFKGKAK